MDDATGEAAQGIDPGPAREDGPLFRTNGLRSDGFRNDGFRRDDRGIGGLIPGPPGSEAFEDCLQLSKRRDTAQV